MLLWCFDFICLIVIWQIFWYVVRMYNLEILSQIYFWYELKCCKSWKLWSYNLLWWCRRLLLCEGHNFLCTEKFEIRRLRSLHDRCIDSKSEGFITIFKEFWNGEECRVSRIVDTENTYRINKHWVNNKQADKLAQFWGI